MRRFLLLPAAVLCLAGSAGAQSRNGGSAPIDSVSIEGILRASAVVDSVFVDRLAKAGEIAPGDFGAYLLARLGVEPFPEDLAWRVRADSGILMIHGRFKDLPEESRGLFGTLLLFVDSTTTLAAEVRTRPAGPGLARFRLERVLVNGIAVPEFVMTSILNSVGREYPALTESGRDLYLQVPPEGRVLILPGRIALDMLAPVPAAVRPPG
ncbi:MAG: hypothetical protein SGI84_06770 [Gemmatimonadota bacterium]|nr:hypothetical protein [Gemmatimonadota bacterium]